MTHVTSEETRDRLRAYAESLTKDERVLLLVRDELYEGSWDELADDLQARRNTKPCVFKLRERIEDDLGRIERLRAFEQEQGVDLRALLDAVDGAQEGMTSP